MKCQCFVEGGFYSRGESRIKPNVSSKASLCRVKAAFEGTLYSCLRDRAERMNFKMDVKNLILLTPLITITYYYLHRIT